MQSRGVFMWLGLALLAVVGLALVRHQTPELVAVIDAVTRLVAAVRGSRAG